MQAVMPCQVRKGVPCIHSASLRFQPCSSKKTRCAARSAESLPIVIEFESGQAPSTEKARCEWMKTSPSRMALNAIS